MSKLILHRKSGQSIKIGDIHVTVLGILEHPVKLAIEAPREIVIAREDHELLDPIVIETNHNLAKIE